MAILISPSSAETNVIYDQEAFNLALKDWLKGVEIDARIALNQVGLRGAKLRSRSYKRSGVIYRMSITYARKAIWIHYGASRGYGGLGSSWRNTKGELVKTNPRSYGLMNTGLRRAKSWKDDIFTKHIPELEDIVSRYTQGMIIKVYG